MRPFEAKKNAEAANHIVGIDAEVHELDWCSFDNADLACLLQNVDCIVGADIFFEPALFKGRVLFHFLYYFSALFFLMNEALHDLMKQYLNSVQI